MPQPCIGSRASALSTIRSRVPWRTSAFVGRAIYRSFLSSDDRSMPPVRESVNQRLSCRSERVAEMEVRGIVSRLGSPPELVRDRMRLTRAADILVLVLLTTAPLPGQAPDDGRLL